MVFLATLLIPVVITALGFIIKKKPPKKINNYYGYRTKRSRRSQEAWDLAQALIADYWIKWGIILLVVSAIMAVVLNFKHDGTEDTLAQMLVFGQAIVVILTFRSVETELKEKFPDEKKTGLAHLKERLLEEMAKQDAAEKAAKAEDHAEPQPDGEPENIKDEADENEKNEENKTEA